MSAGNYALHPELIDDIPLVGGRIRHALDDRVTETLIDDSSKDGDITLVIRALNEATELEKLFEDINKQAFSGQVEVIVVDNESSDNTPEVARFYDAEVVTLPRSEFTYPRSMNVGVEAASHDTVMLTVGHALLSNNHSLHAGTRHFAKDREVAGTFASVLPNKGASTLENLFGVYSAIDLAIPAHKVSKTGLGVLAATGAVISKAAWEELGKFDERYETGGEDSALAGQMLKAGYQIVKEPALTVHHSHGLGPIDALKQLIHWQRTLSGPRQFDLDKLLARRPDLRRNID